MAANEEPISIKNITKEAIIEWFSSTTAHALPNIVKTRNGLILKIIWVCCFIACTIYCSISLKKMLDDYYSFSSTTSTKYISESPALFPAVTFCNIKTVDKQNNPDFVNNYLDPISVAYLNYALSILSYPNTYIESVIHATRYKVNNNFSEIESKKKIGYQLEDMLLSCYFNYFTCSKDDFVYYYDPLRGNCYTFNSGRNGSNIKKVSAAAGTFSGLVLELFLGNVDNETYYQYNDGVLVSIHNQSHAPFTTGVELKAPANAETDFIVNRNFINRLPSPHGNCVDVNSKNFKSMLVDYILNDFGYNYSQTYCFSLCQQLEIINKCNCSDLRRPVFKNNTNYCNDFSTSICIINVLDSFNSNQTTKCNELCPFECESVEYSTSSNKALYPNKFYLEQVLVKYVQYYGKNITVNSQSVAKVNVYYESMNYAVTTSSISITVDDLFSNFGGTLGLYLGISILSMVEIIEFGFNVFVPLIKYFKTKKQLKIGIENS
jgi:hypothetical protein